MSLSYNRNSSGLFPEAYHFRNRIADFLRNIDQVLIIMMSIALG